MAPALLRPDDAVACTLYCSLCDVADGHLEDAAAGAGIYRGVQYGGTVIL